MAEALRVGIIGGGWPGGQHARGYLTAGNFKLAAVADLIPQRRKKLMAEFQIGKEFADAMELVKSPDIDVVSVCLPNHLHAPVSLAALRAGKHVLCEKPPGITAAEARRLQLAAVKASKVLMYGFQRRFGGHEQAAKLAIAKGFAGDIYHARAVWTRTRGIPLGTGWYTKKELSGGGALMDVGLPMLDLAWYLMGQPKPLAIDGLTHRRFADSAPQDVVFDVEDTAIALVRFEGGKSLELACSWAINQAQSQNGSACRLHGTAGAIEVYTPTGPVLYHNFNAKGEYRENPLKPPKTTLYPAMMRHFKECILSKTTPSAGGAEGVTLMQMIDAIYRSAANGKSVTL